MRTLPLYKPLAVATLVGVLAQACCCQWPWSTGQPTPAPYTPPPPGTVSPVVIQRTPERGEELPPDGVIQLVFDRAIAASESYDG